MVQRANTDEFKQYFQLRHTGVDLLHDPALNKGTAFTEEERQELKLEGLLPPKITTQQEQVQRVMENFRKKPTDIEKYIYMVALQDRNETLFYRVVMDHIDEMMPIIYTPTVGRACQLYGNLFRRPRGFFLNKHQKGRFQEILHNWPEKDVRVIVVTDGERILGLGDLGSNGMGIPVGKLALYTACAGVHPIHALPVTLDVGTNNQELIDNPLYLGLKEPRLRGEEYDELVEEFMEACKQVFPKALVQFEDFANLNAFRLLEKYRDKACVFNDDIQGTASVALAGLYAGLRIKKAKLSDEKFLFMGAGEAAIGIGKLIVNAMMEEGMSEKEAKEKLWFFDSKGLVHSKRQNLQDHKTYFAHDHAAMESFLEAIEVLKPTGIIGVSAHARLFNEEIVKAMARLNDRPFIFALSNPTSKAEVTAKDAVEWTDGRVIYASGSPFPAVDYKGKTFVPGQGNNAYVFPGIGLGVVISGAKHVTNEMFMVASKTLAEMVSEERLNLGCIYPPFSDIQLASAKIAEAVCKVAIKEGIATEELPDNIFELIEERQYWPLYRSYV